MPAAPRPYLRSLARGARCRCPQCGQGRLFRKYLKVSPSCLACGHDLDRYPADDGPAYFSILLIGHLIIAPMLFIIAPFLLTTSPWILVPALVIPVAALTLVLLPVIKGAVIGVLYALDINRADAHLHTADAAE
ncbi:MAG: DUF983 domain-containing protein [Caulobacterales bacterium]